MDEKRDRAGYASDEPVSPYSDAYYVQAPETRRSWYGYSVAQCYAHASEEPRPTAESRKKRRVGLASLAIAMFVFAGLLTAGILHSESDFSDTAGDAEDELTRSIYAAFTASTEAPENDPLDLRQSTSAGRLELTAGDIYDAACRCTVGVTVPDYARISSGRDDTPAAVGAGIILTEDGYILTNYRVIEAAYQSGVPILVRTCGGDEYAAEVAGTDMDSGLTVLKIDAQGLTPAALGDSDELQIGQAVYAVGDPLGELELSMTSGIISALESGGAADAFQIDAAVGRGSCGGPVFNACGQVIGVVTEKHAGIKGMGFAVPVNDACAVASDLAAQGYVSGKTFLGLTLTSVSPSAARYYDMVQGAFIYSVEEGGCFDIAGLTAGDIITAVDGQSVSSAGDFVRAIRRHRAGDSAELTVFRGQDTISATVVFDSELPPGPFAPASREPDAGG